MITRTRRTLGVALAALLLSAVAATQLASTPSTELLAGQDTRIAQAGRALNQQFGQDPIVVVVRGDLQQTLAVQQLTALLTLEGRLAGIDGVKSVYGPGTFINQTVVQAGRIVERELGATAKKARAAAEAARTAARERGASKAEADRIASDAFQEEAGGRGSELSDLMVRFGSVGLPSLSNRGFVNQLVFGAGTQPKRRFQWLFPDAEHAVVLVRPKAGISGPAMLALGERVKRLARNADVGSAKLQVAGLPLLAASLERETRSEILRLAPVALGAMLLLLLVVLRRRRGRFTALGLALGALALTMGLSWPLGLGLTVSTVAALPVILGLGLDFAVQLQARYWMQRTGGAPPARAATAARGAVGPTLALAAGAMSLGFLVLLVSPVPLVDRLGAVLALGTISAAVVALGVGPALLVATDRGPVAPLALPAPRRLIRFTPSPVALVAVVALAVAGLAVSGRVQLQSDLGQLAPPSLTALQDVQAVQKEIGTSGQISVAVRAEDVTDPKVLGWIARFGAAAERADKRLRPGPNLADLVTGGDVSAPITDPGVKAMLGLLPPYFVNAVVDPDRRLTELTYGVPFVSVAEQGRIVRRIDAALDGAPAGVQASTAGLVAESAVSTRELDGSRPDLLLLGAAIIALVLYAFWRDARRVAVVLAPAMLAAGLSSLVLAALGATLSPLAAALEPLVLAIGLEFGMLLDMSFRQARAAGHSPTAARAVATRDIGAAVGLSAATVAVGFAVLGASRLPLLAQLGGLVAAELVLCLLVAVVVVPMACEWLDLPGGARRPGIRRTPAALAPTRMLKLRRTPR